MLLKNKLILFITVFSANIICQEVKNSVEISVKPQEFEKMNLMIGLLGSSSGLKQAAQKIKADFEFGGQFQVIIREFTQLKNKSDLADAQKDGYSLILFLNSLIGKDKKNGIEWRLYDTEQTEMLEGKKVYQTNVNSSISHIIADQVWRVLTGTSGSFSSVIAACKRVCITKKKHNEHIYFFHPTELVTNQSIPKAIVEETGICLAPRWHNKKPVLYYSKHTPYNVRLMSVNLAKQKKIVSDFDGLNMTPAFCGDEIVISLTKNGKSRLCSYQFDEIKKKGTFVPITNNSMHAVSPSFIDHDQILFCSVNNDHNPIAAVLNVKTGKVNYLTEIGNCVSPVYCLTDNNIAYCKKTDGFYQVFVYNLESKENKQMTFDAGDKDELSPSPCGNYLVFSIENLNKSRIAVLNILTGERKFITPENEYWSDPAWSAIYDEIPL